MNGPEFRNADGLIDTKACQVECKTERIETVHFPRRYRISKSFFIESSLSFHVISLLFFVALRGIQIAPREISPFSPSSSKSERVMEEGLKWQQVILSELEDFPGEMTCCMEGKRGS